MKLLENGSLTMKNKYEIYLRIIQIKEIGKTVFTWLASKDNLPSQISSDKGIGRDCGGTTLNHKTLEVAVKEMALEIEEILSPKEVKYYIGNPPWEGKTEQYIDKYGLISLIKKLNQKRGKNENY